MPRAIVAVSSSRAVGSYVYSYGSKAGYKQVQIAANNVTATGNDGMTIKGQGVTSGTIAGGDSGGPGYIDQPATRPCCCRDVKSYGHRK